MKRGGTADVPPRSARNRGAELRARDKVAVMVGNLTSVTAAPARTPAPSVQTAAAPVGATRRAEPAMLRPSRREFAGLRSRRRPVGRRRRPSQRLNELMSDTQRNLRFRVDEAQRPHGDHRDRRGDQRSRSPDSAARKLLAHRAQPRSSVGALLDAHRAEPGTHLALRRRAFGAHDAQQWQRSMGSIVSIRRRLGPRRRGPRPEARRGRRRAEERAPRHRGSEGPGQAVGARHAALRARELPRHASRRSRTSTKFQGRAGNAVDDGFPRARPRRRRAVPGSYASRSISSRARTSSSRTTVRGGATTSSAPARCTIATRRPDLRRRHRRRRTTRSRASPPRSTRPPQSESVLATVVTGTGGARLTLTARNDRARRTRSTITQSGGDGGLAALVYPPSGVTGSTQLEPAARRAARSSTASRSRAPRTRSAAPSRASTLTLLAVNDDGETTQVTSATTARPRARRSTISSRATTRSSTRSRACRATTSRRAQGGPLFGDAGVRNIVFQLRRELLSSVAGVSGPFDMLTRSASPRSSTASSAVDAARPRRRVRDRFRRDRRAVRDGGVGHRRASSTRCSSRTCRRSGVFDSRTASLQSSIEDITERREALNQRLLALQARYTQAVQRARRPARAASEHEQFPDSTAEQPARPRSSNATNGGNGS